MMRDSTAMFNRSGVQVAAIGFNEAHGLWQIVVLQREELEFFCPTNSGGVPARQGSQRRYLRIFRGIGRYRRVRAGGNGRYLNRPWKRR
jgi:hypothetical protein